MDEIILSVLNIAAPQAVDMTLYRCSLVGALSLMLFFSVTFIFRPFPEGEEYRRYGQARCRLGLALLALSANYAVHLFWAPRFSEIHWTILMNIDTYYLAAWLFGSSMLNLLSHGFNTRRRDIINVGSWLLFCTVTVALMAVTTSSMGRTVLLLISSLLFMLYTLRLALRLLDSYRRAVQLLDSYYSDDVAAYVRWMSVFTYLAVFYGIGQGIFTFIPDRYVFLWILSSIPFYSYGYLSYINYFLGVKKVDEGLNSTELPDAIPVQNISPAVQKNDEKCCCLTTEEVASEDSLVGERLERWIANRAFSQQGLTIVQLAQEICTNRTYLSAYINTHYQVSFREWINSLRVDYAKQLLASDPNVSVGDVAQRVGYVSLSSFIRAFTTCEGTNPGRWRKDNSSIVGM